MNEKLRRWWKSLTPQKKRYFKYGIALGVIFVIVSISVLATSKHVQFHKALHKAKSSKQVFSYNLHNLSGQTTQDQLLALKKQIRQLQGIIAAQNHISTVQLRNEASKIQQKLAKEYLEHPVQINGQVNPNQSSEAIKELEAQIQAENSEIENLEEKQNIPSSSNAPQAPSYVPARPIVSPFVSMQSNERPVTSATTSTPQATNTAYPALPSPPKKKLHINLSLPNKHHLHSAAHSLVKVSSGEKIVIPAGSIITGVTLNGIDARTGPGSRNNPQIVDIRVKKSAILPNGYRSSIRNCDIIASGNGSLVSKRVFLRTNELSCVAANGGVISSPIKGYIVGSDGLVGIKGTEISYQGPKILDAAIAGFLGSLGGASAPTETQGLDLNPGQTQNYQLPSAAYLGYSAAFGGISQAGNVISRFYLKQAEELQPTIQINPGISVSIILEYPATVHLKGDTKRQLQKTSYQVSEQLNQNATSSVPNAATPMVPMPMPNSMYGEPPADRYQTPVNGVPYGYQNNGYPTNQTATENPQ